MVASQTLDLGPPNLAAPFRLPCLCARLPFAEQSLGMAAWPPGVAHGDRISAGAFGYA